MSWEIGRKSRPTYRSRFIAKEMEKLRVHVRQQQKQSGCATATNERETPEGPERGLERIVAFGIIMVNS